MTAADGLVAAGYFAYYGAFGVFQPYFSVHLAHIGYGGGAIGVLLALWGAMRIPGPLLAAGLADGHDDQRPLLRRLAFVSVAAAALLVAARAPLAVGGALAALSLVFNALMPVYDSYALDRLGASRHRYGWFRLWGSVGFVVMAAATGFLNEQLGAGVIGAALLALVVATALLYLPLPAVAVAPVRRLDPGEFVAAMQHPQVRLFLAVCFLHVASFGAYYGFYTLYLARAGYGLGLAGILWGTGVVAEIALFMVGPRLVGRFPLAKLLRVALVASVVRWLLLAAFPGALGVQFLAQTLHLAAFGLFHSVAVLLGPSLMPPGARARAQALVSSLGWGAGGMAGSLLAGLVWDRAGPEAMFLVAAVVGLGAVALSFRLVPRAPSGSA